MPTIDKTTYQKASLPIGTGYDRRPKGLQPSSIIIHTTNGRRGSSFGAEADYIYRSDAIGAHALVGKQGQIVQFLDPMLRAWHAGVTPPAYINSRSIGIECHITPGESWPTEQHDALTFLVRAYMQQYGIAAQLIDTHRSVALPKGRKIDPSEWSDPQFYAWRAGLAGLQYLPQQQQLPRYVVIADANVRQAPTTDSPVALAGHCVLAAGFTFGADVTVKGQALRSGDQWVHIVDPAAWGFVHSSCVRRI